jgi:hypothetical protein
VLSGAGLVALANRFMPSLRGVAHLPLAAAVVLLLLQNVVAAVVFHRALDHGATGNPNFSPAIYKLVKFVDAHPKLPVVSVDWGTQTSLMALANSGPRRRFRDLWPTFIAIGNGTVPPSRLSKMLGAKGETLFVMHPDAAATFEPALAGFTAVVKRECRNAPVQIRDEQGSVVFLAVILPNTCLRTSPAS